MSATDKLFESLRSTKKNGEEKYQDVLSCLEQGADVNATDAQKKNNTPLHIAVQNGDFKIIELLLNKGADVNIKNDLKLNPLELARLLPEVDENILTLLTTDNNETNFVSKGPERKENDGNDDEQLLMHDKREGTASGLSGQFYETKLLSLILFRCLTDETIENFYLGTNVKDVGDLDDVCLKYKLKNESKPRMLFIQAKHKDHRGAANNITVDDLKYSDDFKLTKYYESYKKIREKFNNEKDIMFKGKYEDVDCDFIIFTPSENTIDKKYKTNSIIMDQHRFEKLFCSRDNLKGILEMPKFNDIHETFQISDERLLLQQIINQDLEHLSEIFKAYILKNNDLNYQNIMTKDLVKRYHVVLAQKVIDVGDLIENKPNEQLSDNLEDSGESTLIGSANLKDVIEKQCRKTLEGCGEGTSKGSDNKTKTFNEKVEGYKKVSRKKAQKIPKGQKILNENPAEKHRKGTFRTDFFHTEDKLLSDLRDKIFKDLKVDDFKPESFSFKLPKCFGNLDLTVNGEMKKKTRRIDYLARTIIKLANISKETKVIRIDKNIFNQNDGIKKNEDQINMGFIDIDGGIAGLVGNLLVIDNETGMFQLNQNEDSLRENSRLLLEKIKTQFKNQFGDESIVNQYRFDIDINNFPKLCFDCDEHEKYRVKDYLSKLWFLTNQCQQKEIQDIVKMEIKFQYRQESKNRLLPIQSDAIFLKFHEKIQEWWMTKSKAKYLTTTCDFYENSKKEIIDSPILTVLNLVTINNIRKNLNIKFKGSTIQKLGLQSFLSDFNSNILNIVTTESFITMVKLTQYFENKENTCFLDFEYILENGYFEMMKKELQTTLLEKIIINQKKQDHTQQLCKLIADMIGNDSKKKKIIVVTEKNIAETMKSRFNVACDSQDDDKCDLTDISDSSTASQNWTLIFQGQEVQFGRVIEEDSKRLVNSHILTKLINNDTVEIGKPLANKRYDEIKQYCIPRNLTRGDNYSMKTFKDINENVVLIVAEPGMGKSVLMNQLAFQTKEYEHNCSEHSSWIVFINLRDYSSIFKSWKDKRENITKNEAIRFICKTAINRLDIIDGENTIDKRQKNKIKAFKLVEKEEIHLKSFNNDGQISFELELFINYYNKGNVIFIFDGFDEICPQYEKQVSSLIRELTRSYHLSDCELLNPTSIIQNAMSIFNQKPAMTCKCPLMGTKQQRTWVTTRSYSNIKSELETVLGRTAFTLKPLSKVEQSEYLLGYFEINFNLRDLTEEDIGELNEFLDYMVTTLSDESRHIAMVSVPLYAVYVSSIKYFYVKIVEDTIADISFDIGCFRSKCAHAYSILTGYGPVFDRQQNIRELTAMSENPLHLYMAAEYFCSQIKEHKSQDNNCTKKIQNQNKWDVNTKSFDLFEKFLETKFMKIRFEEKNDLDTSRSDIETTLNREKLDFIEKHKKMALCAIFDRKDLKLLLPESLFDNIDDLMIKINTGEEKTGVIVNVIDKVPRFVHLVFAEYFAIEYIGDLLKDASKSIIEHPTLEELWRFIINIVLYKSTGGVRTFFDHKLRNDSELMNLINSEQSKRIVFETLIKQGRENQVTPEGFNSLFTMLRTSLNIAVEESLFDIQNYIFECIKFSLNEENVDEFTEITSNSLLVLSALGTNNDDLILRMKDCLSDLPNGLDKFIDMVLPSFVRKVIPIRISPDTLMPLWNMLSGMIPQLANVDFESAELTPPMRFAVMDYVRLLWDLITNVYRF
ncbi:hypothetical protein ABMA27_002806 [Loxostege sticticalis]|uniref:Uncharacterized protein n=1 Tax=Loxostege sticticalis TaxID=481309 RepID=A0ABR3HV02_LOXSC